MEDGRNDEWGNDVCLDQLAPEVEYIPSIGGFADVRVKG